MADDRAVEALLEQRARALARPPESTERRQAVTLVVLEVAGESHGVPIRHVEEVRPASVITPVPGSPPFWAGVVNIRGTLYPVLDLRRYLHLEEASGWGRLVRVSANGVALILLVDGVSGIREVPVPAIHHPPPGAPDRMAKTVTGMTADGLSVLDLEGLLTDAELVVEAASP